MRKFLSAILSVVMLLTLATPAFAALPDDTIVSPQYTYIRTITANISIDEDTGIATCKATCLSASGYTVEVVCQLQRYSGSSWTTLKTWTASGTRYASVNENWAVSSGYTYRVYVSYRIRNTAGSLLESTTGSDSYVYPKQ